MAERGVIVDPTTLYRWLQHYAPELKKGRLRTARAVKGILVALAN